MDSLSSISSAPNGTCYSITNRASPWSGNPYTYVPCNLTAVSLGQHSACCAPGDTCLSNGLCKFNPPPSGPALTFNSYWRIGCTDPTYQDPACPRQCKNVENVERHVHIVFECPGDGQWCCGTGSTLEYEDTLKVNTTCCNDKKLSFKERDGEGEAYTTARKDWESVVEAQSAAVLSVSGTMPTGSEGLVSATATASRNDASLISGAMSGTATAPAISSEGTMESSSESAKPSPVALGVGLGLGIPVLIGLVVAAAFWFYRSRHRKGDPMVELSDNDVGRGNPHAFSVEKSGREVPAELGADTGPFEVWTPEDKRLDFDRGRAEGYR